MNFLKKLFSRKDFGEGDEEERELDDFLDNSVRRFGQALGDEQRISMAMKQYLLEGTHLGLSPYDLWDYFSISTPGIPEQAGFSNDEIERVKGVYAEMSKAMFEK